MRILSSIHDYWDGALANSGGGDKTILFLRNNSEEYITGLGVSWPLVPYFKSNLNITFGIVGFCGLMYPYVRIKTWDDNPDKGIHADGKINIKDVNYYKYEEVESLLKGMEVKISVNSGYTHMLSLESVKGFYDSVKANEKLKQLFRDKQVAYFHVEQHDHSYSECVVELHCILKEVEFYRVFSVTEAYQQVEMFITNVLAPRDNPYEEPISDKLHAQKKGFDEWSFRKAGRKGVGK
jgi:hypothetical protein